MGKRALQTSLFLLLVASAVCFASQDAIIQSDDYWVGEARPFGILEHAQQGNSLYVVMMDVEPEQLILKNITLSSQDVSFSAILNDSNRIFFPVSFEKNQNSEGFLHTGQKVLFFEQIGGKARLKSASCNEGAYYEYLVTIRYSKSDSTGSDLEQIGSKKIIGKCGEINGWDGRIMKDANNAKNWLLVEILLAVAYATICFVAYGWQKPKYKLSPIKYALISLLIALVLAAFAYFLLWLNLNFSITSGI